MRPVVVERPEIGILDQRGILEANLNGMTARPTSPRRAR